MNNETDLQKANDPKFTLGTIILLITVLILSLIVFYIFG